MNARKAWLQNLGSRWQGPWSAEGRRAIFDGPIRLETRRTSYLFVDGVCTEVVRRDGGGDAESPMLGMHLAGFVRDGEVISEGWLPGSRAVLHRPNAAETGELAVALTSPAFACMRAAVPANDLAVAPPSERRIAPRPPAPSYADIDPASLGRIRVSA